MSETVDTIDIGPLFDAATPDRLACDSALWDGLKRTGAVVISGYPDADRVDAGARKGLELFTAPDAVRAPLVSRHNAPDNPNWYRGYHPCTGERLLQNDFYDMGPETPPGRSRSARYGDLCRSHAPTRCHRDARLGRDDAGTLRPPQQRGAGHDPIDRTVRRV